MRELSHVNAVQRAEKVVKVIEAHREFAEEHRRLADEVVVACRESGLFLLNAPVEVGGLEATPREAFEAVELVSRADPSVAWHLTNSSAAGHAAAWVDPAYWDEVFTSNRGSFGFSAAAGRLTTTDGGYRLTGEWPLVTGVSDSTYCALMAIVEGAIGPDARLCLVATADLVIDEVWAHAAAMRGTGSHRVVVEDVFVPAALALDFRMRPVLERPRFEFLRIPHIGAIVNAAVPVGVLQAVIEAVGNELRGKVSTISGATAVDMASILELAAEAQAAVHSLRYGALGLADELWATVSQGKAPALQQRASIAGMPFYAVSVARKYISDLYSRSSRAAFFNGHPLERALRNIHALAYGFESLRTMQHDAGRVALGIEPPAPRF